MNETDVLLREEGVDVRALDGCEQPTHVQVGEKRQTIDLGEVEVPLRAAPPPANQVNVEAEKEGELKDLRGLCARVVPREGGEEYADSEDRRCDPAASVQRRQPMQIEGGEQYEAELVEAEDQAQARSSQLCEGEFPTEQSLDRQRG